LHRDFKLSFSAIVPGNAPACCSSETELNGTQLSRRCSPLQSGEATSCAARPHPRLLTAGNAKFLQGAGKLSSPPATPETLSSLRAGDKTECAHSSDARDGSRCSRWPTP